MENAAMLTVASSLSPEETTVGGQISITHLAPSAVGTEIDADSGVRCCKDLQTP